MTVSAPVRDASDLTHFIETRYHQRHRTELPLLAEMAARVERVHADDDRVPEGLAALLRQMIGELEVHMKKAELILFPAIRAGRGPGIAHRIVAMRADHDDHERIIAEIRRLTRDMTLPEVACGAWTALYAGLTEFLAELTEHLRLENEVLFPPFESNAPAGT